MSSAAGGNPRLLLTLPLVAAFFSGAFALLVPLGESPDELAHFRYAQLLSAGRLPAPGQESDGKNYEAHQPPLGYLLPALVLALRPAVELEPRPNPELDFNQGGSRAFRSPFAGERDANTLRAARLTQALWAALAAWAGLQLAGSSPVAIPYLLAPQLLFVCGTLNNDAALVALSTCALLLLVRHAETGRHALMAAFLVTLALFTKASAAFLLPAVFLSAMVPTSSPATGRLHFTSRWKLLGATATGVAAWIALQLLRTGTAAPRIPSAVGAGSAIDLLLEPRWIGGLFRSFWAKFGWLNSPMPWPFYLLFGLLSLVAVVGFPRLRGARLLILSSALVTNVALLLTYLLLIDQQAQGRYLLPSIGVLAAAAAAASVGRLKRWFLPVAIFNACAALATVVLYFHE